MRWCGLVLVLAPTVALALAPPHDASNGISCLDCHGAHSGGMGFGLLPHGDAQEAMCKTCHNPTGMASAMHAVTSHRVADGALLLDCGACHNVHGPSLSADPHPGGIEAPNLSLVRDDVDAYWPGAVTPAVFQMRPQHFAFSEEAPPWNGICQSCHTQTAHHRNDSTAGHHHQMGLDCTTCHPHDAGFLATGGCTECHAEPQGERRAITSEGGDFSLTSHHVRGEAQDSDCATCHYMGAHTLGTVKLIDPDQGATHVFDVDPTSLELLEPYCLACHDQDGAAAQATPLQPFSDGARPPDVDQGGQWDSSAHKVLADAETNKSPLTCLGAGTTGGCHANGHGSDSVKILAGAPVGDGDLQAMCFGCHTEGKVKNHALADHRPGGYESADDIQEAFDKPVRHDLGTTFEVGGQSFTLQCTSCHNPHVASGRYWDAESQVSPVSRPDFSDPVNNPRAMGRRLWGASPGEKMDDFAARAAGTGGWAFATARGGLMANDKPAVYRPPRQGNGYDAEFSGAVLPDYTTLCLDCHSHRMSAANPPVNWGQGIPCTDNSVDPPDQRVECGAQHGLGRAGQPAYVSDAGKAGFWGSGGNPDVLFQMNYVTRGRHNGHFMRWPYETADRAAGINFVLSCTDCHEAHGSSRGGILRERFNVNANGDCGSGGDSLPNGENCASGSNWNAYCNACHYYYGGQHAQMSCGTASCHEANSIHRIIHVVDSGSASQLMLTAAGHEADYKRPDFTPEILTAEGAIGSATLKVRLSRGAFGGPELSTAISPEAFWLFDSAGQTTRWVESVSHEPGADTLWATLSSPLGDGDLGHATLALRSGTVWAGYEGGYQNWATGLIGARPVSGGPWPVTIVGGLRIKSVVGAVGYDGLRITLSRGAFASAEGVGALTAADLLFADTDDGRSIVEVDHYPGASVLTARLSAPLDADGDVGQDAIAVSEVGAAYGADGLPMGSQPVVVSGNGCPTAGARFDFSEPAGAVTSLDDSGLLAGTVQVPAWALLGDGLFHGDEHLGTGIVFEQSAACMISPRYLTVEARLRPESVDLDTGVDSRNSTRSRVAERRRTYQLTIMRADWAGDNVPTRAGKARFMFKYRVPAPYRRDCGEDGPGAWWKQVSTDIDAYPIVSNHWYRVRVVFNADKATIPVDIWVDDLGPAGLDEGELWAGFVNAAHPDPAASGGCKWVSQAKDEMETEAQQTSLGAPANGGDQGRFKGVIDWVSWKPVVDYDGIDSLPH